MDFDLPEETLMLREMLRRFVFKEAQPLEMRYFTAGFLAPEERARLQRAVEQMGLWGLTVPEVYGGGGLDLVSTCVIEEELGKTFIPVEIGDVPAALYACSGGQAGDYLEPALAGERRAVIAAREPDALHPDSWITVAETGSAGGYLLSGRKLLSVSPGEQDFIIVYARATEGLTAFMLDVGLPGMTLSANGALTLTLHGLQVQEQAVLGNPGGALTLGMEEAPKAWIRSGARYVGMVDRLIEMSLEHARAWISLGEALAVRPAIQRMLAEMRVEAESSRWLTYHAAWLADSGAGDELRSAAAQVRLATGEMLKRAVDRVTMIFAGPGPSTQLEPQRFVRSLAPPEVLDLALEQARAVILADMLGPPTS